MLNERIAEACQKTVTFLLNAQAKEGSWADYLPDFSSTGWISGYVGRMLQEAQRTRLAGDEVTEPLQRTWGWLLSIQRPDGGWSWNPRVVTDADSTANCLIFMLNSAEKTPNDVIERAVQALASHQYGDSYGIHTYTRANIERAVAWHTPYFPHVPPLFYGGWMCETNSVSGVCATTFKYAGYDLDWTPLRNLYQYILNQQSPEGYWNAYWWSCPLFPTFHCVEALAQWDDWGPMKRATAWVRRQQQKDGGWQDGKVDRSTPFNTALAVNTLMTAGEWGSRPVDQGIEWLLDHQLEDGSWEAIPNQQVPLTFRIKPWEDSPAGIVENIFEDDYRLFTTATVLAALVKYYEEGMFYDDDVVFDRIHEMV